MKDEIAHREEIRQGLQANSAAYNSLQNEQMFAKMKLNKERQVLK